MNNKLGLQGHPSAQGSRMGDRPANPRVHTFQTLHFDGLL
jgi:hypothetical protein